LHAIINPSSSLIDGHSSDPDFRGAIAIMEFDTPQSIYAVLEAIRVWKSRWRIQDLLADGRCSQAVLDFLSATDVGRQVPAE